MAEQIHQYSQQHQLSKETANSEIDSMNKSTKQVEQSSEKDDQQISKQIFELSTEIRKQSDTNQFDFNADVHPPHHPTCIIEAPTALSNAAAEIAHKSLPKQWSENQQQFPYQPTNNNNDQQPNNNKPTQFQTAETLSSQHYAKTISSVAPQVWIPIPTLPPLFQTNTILPPGQFELP